MNIITLETAIHLMHNNTFFDVTFVTADLNRKTGGTIKRLKRVRLSKQEKEKESQFFKKRPQGGKLCYRPNHLEHGTRNIVLPGTAVPGGEIRKLHLRLITEFNGKTVVY